MTNFPLVPVIQLLGFEFPTGQAITEGKVKLELDMPAGTSPLGNDTDPLNFIYNPFFDTDIKTGLSVFLLELSYSKSF